MTRGRRRVHELDWHAYASYRAAFVLIHTGRIAEATGQVHENLSAAQRLRDRGLLADAVYVRHWSLNCADSGEEARGDTIHLTVVGKNAQFY